MLSESYKAISKYLHANWSSTTIAEANTLHKPSGAAFIRPTVLPVDNYQAELGDSGKNRMDAILSIDIFVPVGGGEGIAVGYADIVLGLFARNTTLTEAGLTLHFGVPVAKPARDDGNGYYQTTVDCPWFIYY